MSRIKIVVVVLAVFIMIYQSLLVVYSIDQEPFSLNVRILKHKITREYVCVEIIISIYNAVDQSYPLRIAANPEVEVLDTNNRILYAMNISLNTLVLYPGENKLYDTNLTIHAKGLEALIIRVFSGTYIISGVNGEEYNLSEVLKYKIQIISSKTTLMKTSNLSNTYPPVQIGSKIGEDRKELSLNITPTGYSNGDRSGKIEFNGDIGSLESSIIIFYIYSIVATVFVSLIIVKNIFSKILS